MHAEADMSSSSDQSSISIDRPVTASRCRSSCSVGGRWWWPAACAADRVAVGKPRPRGGRARRRRRRRLVAARYTRRPSSALVVSAAVGDRCHHDLLNHGYARAVWRHRIGETQDHNHSTRYTGTRLHLANSLHACIPSRHSTRCALSPFPATPRFITVESHQWQCRSRHLGRGVPT